MTATYTPGAPDTISRVRWLLQDHDTTAPEVQDEEIMAEYAFTDATLDAEPRNYLTALAVATALHTRYAKQFSHSVDGARFELGERAKYWATVVTRLEGELVGTGVVAGWNGVVYSSRLAYPYADTL